MEERCPFSLPSSPSPPKTAAPSVPDTIDLGCISPSEDSRASAVALPTLRTRFSAMLARRSSAAPFVNDGTMTRSVQLNQDAPVTTAAPLFPFVHGRMRQKTEGNQQIRRTLEETELSTPIAPPPPPFRQVKMPSVDVPRSSLARLSQRLREAVGDAQPETSQESSELSPVTAAVDQANNDDDDLSSHISIFSAQRMLKVYHGDGHDFVLVQVSTLASLEDILRAALAELATKNNSLTSEMDLATWRLAKLDRNQLATRIWLSDSNFSATKINDGEELRLKNVRETTNIGFSMPPNNIAIQQCPFQFDDTVEDVIRRIQTMHSLQDDDHPYGLYYKRVGLWLDANRSLISYEIPADHTVELRERSQEFLLRVHLVDFETRFAIKVIPSFSVADVMDIVHGNIQSRKLQLELPRHPLDVSDNPATISNRRKFYHYGLYMNHARLWMEESRLLSHYNVTRDSAPTEDIHFKIQHQPLVVERWSPQTGTTSSLILVYENDSVGDVCDLLEKHETWKDALLLAYYQEIPPTTGIDSLKTFSFGLYTKGNELLEPGMAFWKVLKFSETFVYRMHPIPLRFCTHKLRDIVVTVDVDFCKPLDSHLMIILRRLGIVASANIRGFRVRDNDAKLVPHLSALELRLQPDTDIIVDYDVTASLDTGKPSAETELIYSSDNRGVVIAGTLDKLIEQLTTADEMMDSREYLDYVKTFLLTYQSFTTARILLEKLTARYHVPYTSACGSFVEFEKHRLKIQLRVCNILQLWIKKHHVDFLLPAADASLTSEITLLDAFIRFTEEILVVDHPSLGRQLRKNAYRIKEGRGGTSSQEGDPRFVVSPPMPKLGRSGNSPTLLHFDAEEVARQMTIVEFDLFSRIQPHEFLNQRWTKTDAQIHAAGILAVTKKFNEVAFWVMKTIVEGKTIRSRAKRMTKLIDIAWNLLSLNNFSTLMAFVAGFNKSPVTRLKHTFNEVGSRTVKRLVELETLLSAESSYKSYRSRLHSINPPCVPYLGVYLLDLTYMEDGNPNMLGTLINFAKRRLINSLIQEVQQYQALPFNLKLVPEITDLLKTSVEISDANPKLMKEWEDRLFQLSLEREPRGVDRSLIE